jgi:hypothetical protein
MPDLQGEPSSWHGVTHVLGFYLTLLSMAIAYSASGLALRGNPAWRRWRLLGWTPLLLLIIMFTGAGLPGELSFYLFLLIGFGWYTVMAGRLLALDRATRDPRSASQTPDVAAPGLL